MGTRRTMLAGFVAAVVVLATMGMGVGVAATVPGEAVGGQAASHAADRSVVAAKGGDLYVVFGADTGSGTLTDWIDAHLGAIHASASGATSQVFQYQNVSQVNLNQQGNAVAISIDGGDATAMQQTHQTNQNLQSASSTAENRRRPPVETTSFRNVHAVYVVFASDGPDQFSGWALDSPGKVGQAPGLQTARARVTQNQSAEQVNRNNQSRAIAVAENGSTATALQRSYQENDNVQTADALALNVGPAKSGNASAAITQYQFTNQTNENVQGFAVALAVGQGSVATAIQASYQGNANRQVANASAINFDVRSFREVTAGVPGDFSSTAVVRTGANGDQNATANVGQDQFVTQLNENAQNCALAYATNGSVANASQINYQGNFNAQVAKATAATAEIGHVSLSAYATDSSASGPTSWAVAGPLDHDQRTGLTAGTDISQFQYVSQANYDAQSNAVVYASDGDVANATQITYQVNRNVQVANATAVAGHGPKAVETSLP